MGQQGFGPPRFDTGRFDPFGGLPMGPDSAGPMSSNSAFPAPQALAPVPTPVGQNATARELDVGALNRSIATMNSGGDSFTRTTAGNRPIYGPELARLPEKYMQKGTNPLGEQGQNEMELKENLRKINAKFASLGRLGSAEHLRELSAAHTSAARLRMGQYLDRDPVAPWFL